MLYQYHIRILMHFTRKIPINLLVYLYKRLGKMENKFQAKFDQLKSILFHFSLVNLLVVEELRKLNMNWDSFLTSANISLDPKGDNPLSVEKSTSNSSGVKGGGVIERGKGKDIENTSPSQPILKKRRKLQFIDEPKEKEASRKPLTSSSARRFRIPIV